MNTTNRGANRLFLLITGILLLAAGASAIALIVVPALASTFKQQATSITRQPPGWISDPVAGKASLLTLGIVLVALVLIVLLVVFIVRQGRGHTSAVLTKQTGNATSQIDLGLPRKLLSDDLDGRDELLSNRVVAYRVHDTPMLKISVRARRGVSPKDAATAVTDALHALDSVLGFELPALVQISGGFRARAAKPARLS